jgi:cytidylate kinase
VAGLIIAIDGPSGVGKGTVARAVAHRFGYRHVDTGAMYRAIGWLALHEGIGFEDRAAVAALAETATFDVSGGRVVVNGYDVTSAIRTSEGDRAATAVARLPEVRARLVTRQRAMGAEGGIVMEGRDIGTVVFPQADLKIYLDASPEERARRRASDPAHAGHGTALASVAVELQARDRADATRAASPLTCAPDAVRIDTTGVPVDEVVRQVCELVEQALHKPA